MFRSKYVITFRQCSEICALTLFSLHIKAFDISVRSRLFIYHHTDSTALTVLFDNFMTKTSVRKMCQISHYLKELILNDPHIYAVFILNLSHDVRDSATILRLQLHCAIIHIETLQSLIAPFHHVTKPSVTAHSIFGQCTDMQPHSSSTPQPSSNALLKNWPCM